MAKFYGKIGYVETVETTPGVWQNKIVAERNYSGDLNRINRRIESSGNLNDDINIANELSIVADPFANQNFHLMRYVEYMGTKWKITSVEVKQYPRLVLILGGVYNGEQA